MIDKYWEIIERNHWNIQQQLFCWCNNKGILFLTDDYHQAILQVAEGILKGFWKNEMNYDNVKNYLFITFRNINFLKLKDIDVDNLEDTIYEDITILDSIAVEDEEYSEDDLIPIENVFKFVVKKFGEDKLEGFKNKLLHKHSSISNNQYICILWAVRHHFYPKRDNWYGDYEKTLDNKNKLKQWKLNHPNATKEEYDIYYRELNNSRIKNYQQDWRDNNRDKVKENNEKYKEYRKEYCKKRWLERKKLNNGIIEEKYIP